jgi:hypothetical protein
MSDRSTPRLIALPQMKDLMMEFHRVTRGRKPEHLIFFRDGVSEGQFKEVYYVSRGVSAGNTGLLLLLLSPCWANPASGGETPGGGGGGGPLGGPNRQPPPPPPPIKNACARRASTAQCARHARRWETQTPSVSCLQPRAPPCHLLHPACLCANLQAAVTCRRTPVTPQTRPPSPLWLSRSATTPDCFPCPKTSRTATAPATCCPVSFGRCRHPHTHSVPSLRLHQLKLTCGRRTKALGCCRPLVPAGTVVDTAICHPFEFDVSQARAALPA